MVQKDKGNTNTPINKENITEAKLKLSCESGENWVEIVIPVTTVSEANGGPKKTFRKNGKTYYKGEHWTDKHKRHKKQKGIVFMTLRKYSQKIRLPCVITLTRYAPTKLDKHDNLPMSLKWVLDACCAVATGDYRPGRADDSDEIDVLYRQVMHPEYWVKIRIDFS